MSVEIERASKMISEQTKKLKLISNELNYLRWFKVNADFGPADGDVHMMMEKDYEKETGKKVPEDWRYE